MGKSTAIEWADHSFNPWIGCSKVSEGCAHCYAEREMDHRWKRVRWGPQGQRLKTSAKYWAQPLKWNEAAREAGQVATVFAGSLCDVFEEKPDQEHELDEWRAELWFLIEATPHLTWLLLTKHPDQVPYNVPFRWIDPTWPGFKGWPQNAWLGTSVENQARADERIPELIRLPGKKFLSCEPLLEHIGLRPVDDFSDGGHGRAWLPFIDWIILGGESGPEARPMHPRWAENIRDQALRAWVPFFFKQWGEWMPWIPREGNEGGKKITHVMEDGSEYYPGNYGSPLQSMIRVGKSRAGARLAGKEWRQLPNFGKVESL